MSAKYIEDYYWICPKCEEKVYVFVQIVNFYFDTDDGEAFFNVDEFGGIQSFPIICNNCSSRWKLDISGMKSSDRNHMKKVGIPNEEQRKLIIENKLQPDNWQVMNENKKELEIRSRRSGRRRILEKKNE